MDRKVEIAWQASETFRKSFLERLIALPDEKRTKEPKKGEMSPAAVYQHLVHFEELYLVSIRKQRDAYRGKKPKPRFFFGFGLKRLRSGVVMPALPGTVEPCNDVEGVMKRFDKARSELHQILETASPDEALFKHPIFGVLGPIELLEMIDAHTEYHLKRFPEV